MCYATLHLWNRCELGYEPDEYQLASQGSHKTNTHLCGILKVECAKQKHNPNKIQEDLKKEDITGLAHL